MKEWSVELYLLDTEGKERPADCFTKVTYNLHPSFANATQSTHRRPTPFPKEEKEKKTNQPNISSLVPRQDVLTSLA